MTADLYFGRDAVPDAAWRGFLAEVVTPRFPAGLTQLDGTRPVAEAGTGQDRLGTSTMVRIVTDRDADACRRLEEIRAAYRDRFAQDSVGLVIEDSCASF